MLSRLRICTLACSAFGLASACLPALFSSRAEILPVKTYTADVLPRDAVRQTRQDAGEFIWFCTSEGLVRFDGYNFKLYGKEDGLLKGDISVWGRDERHRLGDQSATRPMATT